MTLTREERGIQRRKKLCKKLDLLIATRGKTNSQIAEHLGIHLSTVTCWRKGKSWIGNDLIDPLCEYLGVTPDWFWTDEEVPGGS